MKAKVKLSRKPHPLSRTDVTVVGDCVAQETDGGFFVMTPDGEIVFTLGKDAADTHCRKWFKRHCPKNEISLGTIKWHFAPKSAVCEVLQPT